MHSEELMAVKQFPLFLWQPPSAIPSFPHFILCIRMWAPEEVWLTRIKMQVHSCARILYTQTTLEHHKPTDIKSTCQRGPQVCDPVWNTFSYTTTAGSNLLVDLNTVHLTCHALYMCCVNVHVSLYILCCPNWHAAGPSSCEAFCACVSVFVHACVCVRACV